MKWFLKGLSVLLIVLLIGVVYIYYSYTSYGPAYEEPVSLSGLQSEVEVRYDDYGIPHIYADNDADAYETFGYIHASERLWQMDLLRRVPSGRLSELFGSATVKTDVFFKTLGIHHQSQKEAQAFVERDDPMMTEKINAYLRGVNTYIDDHPQTLEHRLIGAKMEPYTLTDIYNIIGYMAFSFSIAHKTEPIVDMIKTRHGMEYLRSLNLNIHPDTETILGYETSIVALSTHIHEILETLPVPELIGSNSWVISPQKSASGNVLLANDPHIGYSQPSVWYEAHMITPEMDNYGYHLAGHPLSQIGHNRFHAVGLTMFENDDIDYYRELVHPDDPDKYSKKGEWTDFTTRRETVKIKNGSDTSFVVRETYHGPIISDVVDHIDGERPVSMWWVYQKMPLRLLEATDLISNASTIEEVHKGASLVHAPGLNVMYGDVEGNIAWWAAARLPIRPDHVNPKLILDGSTGADDILGYYDFSENPQAINPKEGFVYSANNQSANADGLHPEGYYLPEDRARRIVHLLSAKDGWTTEDVKTMINDVTSLNVPEIIESLTSALGEELTDQERQAVEVLAKWDGTYDVTSVAPTIYMKWLYHTMHKMMGDELGDAWDIYRSTHLSKRSAQPLIANLSTPWWDDVSTSAVESREMIIRQALAQSMTELTEQLGADLSLWTWGQVHTLRHPHSFTTNETLRDWFDVGTFEVPGALEVINNYQYSIQGDGVYEAVAGPSTRRVINLGDIDNDSWSILPTGQSGNVQSPHYKDQAEMYVNGAFRRQLMAKDDIEERTRYRQTFSPM